MSDLGIFRQNLDRDRSDKETSLERQTDRDSRRGPGDPEGNQPAHQATAPSPSTGNAHISILHHALDTYVEASKEHREATSETLQQLVTQAGRILSNQGKRSSGINTLTWELGKAREQFEKETARNQNWFISKGKTILSVLAVTLLAGMLSGALLHQWWIDPGPTDSRTHQTGQDLLHLYETLSPPGQVSLEEWIAITLKDHPDLKTRLLHNLQTLSIPLTGS